MAKLNFDTVQDYITSLVPPRETEMQEMEKYADKMNFPIIGPAGGYYCYQIARIIGARSVFEMGSGYGYSTAWFAKAVLENGGGVVHHTVWDEKLSKMATGHLSRLGFDGLIQYHFAEAVETLRQTEGPFDLIFNDIDKEAYLESLPLIKTKLRSGGVLIIDNMLWHGQILDPNDHAKSTEAIRNFTKTITTDKDWIVSLAPVRDGMIIAYKK
jgi:caffeoyl-CoA O-methyltransferase